jgi:hypothetical protein
VKSQILFLKYLLIMLCLGLVSTSGKTAVIYDFNGLSTGNLSGQQGWKTAKHGTGQDIEVQAGIGADGTQAICCVPSGSGNEVVATHVNDANFSMPNYSSVATHASFQVDLRSSFWGTEVGLGYDQSGDGHIGRSNAAEKGMVLIADRNQDRLRFVDATGTETVITLSNLMTTDNWFRLKVDMDFTANGGQGEATVSWADAVLDTAFQEVAGLTGLNMGLNAAATDADNVNNWNAVYTSFLGAGGQLDNIAGHVPEPGTLLVFGFGLLGVGAMRRRAARSRIPEFGNLFAS